VARRTAASGAKQRPTDSRPAWLGLQAPGISLLEFLERGVRGVAADDTKESENAAHDLNQVLGSSPELQRKLRERAPKVLGSARRLKVALEMHPGAANAEQRSYSIDELLTTLANEFDADAGELPRQVTRRVSLAITFSEVKIGETWMPEPPPTWTQIRRDIAVRVGEELHVVEPSFKEQSKVLTTSLEQVRGPIIDRLQESLKKLTGKSFGSLEANQAFVAEVRELLRRFDQRVECPSCKEPAMPGCVPGTSPTGAFTFEHRDAKRHTRHGGRALIPPYLLIKPPEQS